MEHGIPDQRRVNQGLLRLREKTGLKLAATNDAHYLHKDDHQAHDVLLCIGSGKKVSDTERLRFDTQHFYLKTAEEMAALFPDHPEALASTVEIAEMCDFTLKGVSTLPAFDVPPGFTIDSYFEKVTRDGFDERRRVLEPLAAGGTAAPPARDYAARLEKEIAVIRRVGFAGYFLIVWDFIRYARERKIPVGPGRGSAAGQPRGLLPAHHRHRPDRVRPDLRALPERGAHQPARHRHRLLRGAPRRGDRVRHAQVRPRERGADHHLRDDEGEGRGARRRPRDGHDATPRSTGSRR